MIPRTVLTKIEPWLTKKQHIILKGARRVGKTNLLKMLEQKIAQEAPQIPRKFLTCDKLDFQDKIKIPADLIFYLKEFYNFDEKKPFYLFLDEFQHIQQAGLFLKNLADDFPQLKIIASGSSSLEITKNSEFLTGRSVEFFIPPISFYEFFQFWSQKKITKKSLTPQISAEFRDLQQFYNFYAPELNRAFLYYLSWGGYPEIILEKQIEMKQKILQEYLEKYIQKDIIHFLKIENISGFNNLLKIAANNIGQLINVNEISNTLNLAHQSVKKYFEIYQGTYLLKLITPFFKNVRSELSKTPRVFFHDLGLRNNLLGINTMLENKIDLGLEVENFVFNQLQNYFENHQIHFYRTIAGSEIDFLVEKNIEEYFLLEVKYRSKVRKPLAFKNFAKKYSSVKLNKFMITKDVLKYEDDIFYVPAALIGLIELDK
jgi:uncharacterized protein